MISKRAISVSTIALWLIIVAAALYIALWMFGVRYPQLVTERSRTQNDLVSDDKVNTVNPFVTDEHREFRLSPAGKGHKAENDMPGLPDSGHEEKEISEKDVLL